MLWLNLTSAFKCCPQQIAGTPKIGEGVPDSAYTRCKTIRRNVTIDWTVKESVKANLRRLVKRLLRKYGYPPEKQEKAMVTVLQQAELLCRDWAA
ncbi:type I restriction enzyme endonuclease domain-containing protein [Nostoc sp. LEGE 12450]|uniref:type I restriction enzyme endonuclease domain-containing protein n=1 Tax=Nostoc sp. LEGE 12450 TaxID=1828643 RepID=UPI001D15A9E6|nr:type I restriction enzyme endonuclease domain-containing protein [Nostoc sp. LEGE 12450]